MTGVIERGLLHRHNKNMTAFTPLKTISYHEAKRILGEHRIPRTVESCPLGKTLGRVLAFPVESQCDLPQFNNSAVDGFAVCEEDRNRLDHETVVLNLIATVEAGYRGELPVLRPGTTVHVLTGGPLPDHTAAVAMQEDVTLDGERIALCGPLSPGRNARWRGEEYVRDSWLYEAGACVTPATIGAMAAAGCDTVEVFRMPKVGILTTGSEIVTGESERQPFQTFDANGPALLAALQAFGVLEVRLLHAPDESAAIDGALSELLTDCDVILTVGGVSVGERDIVRPALRAKGFELLVEGVAIRPGKPFLFGKRAGQVVFGLPGNPLSAMVNYLVFVAPYLRQALGLPCGTRKEKARLSSEIHSKYGLQHFVPGTLADGFFEPAEKRCSSMLTGLGASNALVVIDEEAVHCSAGETVDVMPIRWHACSL